MFSTIPWLFEWGDYQKNKQIVPSVCLSEARAKRKLSRGHVCLLDVVVPLLPPLCAPFLDGAFHGRLESCRSVCRFLWHNPTHRENPKLYASQPFCLVLRGDAAVCRLWNFLNMKRMSLTTRWRVLLGSSGSMRVIMNMNRPVDHYRIDRLKERVKIRYGRCSSFSGRERSMFNETCMCSFSRSAKRGLWGDWTEGAQYFRVLWRQLELKLNRTEKAASWTWPQYSPFFQPFGSCAPDCQIGQEKS